MGKSISIPGNRYEVFFDLFRFHKTEMLKGNLIFLLFSFLSLISIYGYFIFVGLIPSLIENGTLVLGEINGEQISQSFYIFEIRNLLFIILLVTNIPLFIGLGGFVHYLQQIIFGEVCECGTTYREGIKKNSKHFIIYSLFFSVLTLVGNLVISYYSFDLTQTISYFCIPCGVLVLLLILFGTFLVLPFDNLYSGSIWSMYKNSLFSGMASFLRSFGCFVLAVLPLLVLLIPSTLMQVIALTIFVFLFFPYFVSIMILNGNHLQDKYVNPGKFDFLIRRGMVKENQ